MFVLKESRFDWSLVGLVGLLSVGANMPYAWAEYLSIDRRYLIAGLTAVVAVSLVRYLKFTLILVVAILAIGANLTEDLAQELGADPQIMMLGLVSMVVMSLSNRMLKLPSGTGQTGHTRSLHGAAALFHAIRKGRIAVVQSLLAQGVNVNVQTVTGKTPLMAACYKGYGDIVQMLIEHGAHIATQDQKGDTPLKIATRAGNTRVAELLRKAGAQGAAPAPTAHVQPVASAPVCAATLHSSAA